MTLVSSGRSRFRQSRGIPSAVIGKSEVRVLRMVLWATAKNVSVTAAGFKAGETEAICCPEVAVPLHPGSPPLYERPLPDI